MSHEARYKTEMQDVNVLQAALEKLLKAKVEKVSEDKLSYKRGIYRYTYATRQADGNFEVTYDTDMRSVFGKDINDTSLARLKQVYGLFKYRDIYEGMGFTCTVEEQKTLEGLCYVLTGEEAADEIQELVGEVASI